MAGGLVWIDADVTRLTSAEIESGNVAAVLARKDDQWIAGIGDGEAGLAAANGGPVA